MSKSIEFNRASDNFMAHVDERGLWMVAGWTVAIPKGKAIEYVENYNTSSNAGFVEQDGKVVLAHESGRLTLTRSEAEAVIVLIKEVYMTA